MTSRLMLAFGYAAVAVAAMTGLAISEVAGTFWGILAGVVVWLLLLLTALKVFGKS